MNQSDPGPNTLAWDSRYEVRLAANSSEITAALRLRYEVFNLELRCIKGDSSGHSRLDFDEYDFKCRHLIVLDQRSGKTVGTYRLNTIETAQSTSGFYSASEFTIDSLPLEILQEGVELGRACIAREHRNTKVLFMLWKALLEYSRKERKNYFFGCCSLFTQDESEGAQVFLQLKRDGYLDDELTVMPRRESVDVDVKAAGDDTKLPPLFDMYLRLGARVCGPPMLDRDFGSVDFFVVFDIKNLSPKYRKMFR